MGAQKADKRKLNCRRALRYANDIHKSDYDARPLKESTEVRKCEYECDDAWIEKPTGIGL